VVAAAELSGRVGAFGLLGARLAAGFAKRVTSTVEAGLTNRVWTIERMFVIIDL
jgi:hypothetical protein